MFILECTELPSGIVNVFRSVYQAVLVAVPLLIILFGVIDFIKGVASGKADDISKNSRTFVKRFVIGLLVFFVFNIVKWVFTIMFSSIDGTSAAWQCAAAILG